MARDVGFPADLRATNSTFALFLNFDNKQQIQETNRMQECTESLRLPAELEPAFLVVVVVVPVDLDSE